MNAPIETSQAPRSSANAKPDLSPLSASVRRFHGWEPLRVEGTLPPGLRGSLVRAGPALPERFGRRVVHAFEADGALFGLRLPGDGTAQGAVKVVESPGYLEEEAAGKPLYSSAAPWWRRFTNGLRQRNKATGNTSIMTWQGRSFALMEGARPVEFDPASLATIGLSDLGGALGQTFSAHPHRLAAQGVTYNFGQRHGPKPALDLYALPDAGAMRHIGAVDLPFNTMVHDFAVTEGYLVFVISSIEINLGRALLAPKDMLTLMDWNPDGAHLLIVPVDDVAKAVRVPIAARFVFHLANAFRRGDELAIDVLQYPDLGVLSALAGGDEDEGPRKVSQPEFFRLVVDLSTGKLRSDARLWDHNCEFPVLPAASVGAPYSKLWLISRKGDEGGEGSGLVRLDLDTQVADRWDPGEGHVPAEGVFVPDPEGTRPHQGWILSLVLDGFAGASYWAVLDSEHLEDGPLARVWGKDPLPTTFHGAWTAS